MPVPPIHVGTTDMPEVATFLGPHVASGAVYVIAKSLLTRIDVYKSTDNGATWAAQDTANAPLTAFSQFDTAFSGTSIHVVYCKQGTTHYRIRTFNTATDTWGAESAQGPVQQDTNTIDQMVRLVRVASGDLYVFYLEEITNQTIKYCALSGGVWGSEIELVGATGTIYNYLCSAALDSLNVIHVFYRKCAVSGINGQLYHITLTVGGVIGSPDLIDVTVTNVPTGRAIEFSGSLVLPFYDASNFAGVWTGTPTAAPVWTFTLLDSIAWAPGVHDYGDFSVVTPIPNGARPYAFVDSGTAYVVWASTNGPTPDKAGGGYTINRIYYSSNTGSGWSAPVLRYDELTNPGAWYGANDPDLAALSASFYSGDVNIALNLNCAGTAFIGAEPVTITFIPLDEDPMVFKREWIEDPDNQFPWGAIAGVIDISCNNPCDPVLGVPYNHAFTATGTPPYTYSILSGALPTGFTLNSTTGIASGLPSEAGTFSFVVQVIDALLASDTVSCSITVTDHVCPWQLCDLFTTSAACAMDGTVGLRRTADGVTGDSDAVSSNPITVVAGQIYFIEFFLRGSGGADGTISVGYDFYDVNNTYLSSAYVTSTGSPTVFTSFTGTVTVPANAVTAVPVIVANDHLTGIWCIAALFSVLMDNYFILSSIRSYFTDYTMYR